MSINNFKELKAHLSHDVICTWYGEKDNPDNVAIECRDCQEVLIDYDSEDINKDQCEGCIDREWTYSIVNYGVEIKLCDSCYEAFLSSVEKREYEDEGALI